MNATSAAQTEQQRQQAIAYWQQRVDEARHALEVAERSLAALLEDRP